MSDSSYIMTDAPLDVAMQALKDARIIENTDVNVPSFVPTVSQTEYIEIGYDLKLDVDEYETWVGVDERSEELTETIFASFKKLPYNCLRTPIPSDPEERVYIALNARKAVKAKT